jgi:hypothetical protein
MGFYEFPPATRARRSTPTQAASRRRRWMGEGGGGLICNNAPSKGGGLIYLTGHLRCCAAPSKGVRAALKPTALYTPGLSAVSQRCLGGEAGRAAAWISHLALHGTDCSFF